MRSATLSCEKTLIRSDLRHYWPIPFVYILVWIVALPFQMSHVYYYEDMDITWEEFLRADFTSDYLGTLPAAAVIALLFSGAMVMAVFSYLMNSRPVGLMHTLPVKREGQFCAHLASGLGMLLGSNVLVWLISVLVQASKGLVAWKAGFTWLLAVSCEDLLFFALCTVCAMVTGWLLAVPIVYAAANFVAYFLTFLVQALGGAFYYGYSGNSSYPELVYWLTPVARLYNMETRYPDPADPTRTLRGLGPEGSKILAVYVVSAVLLLVLAWVLYRYRASESAGDPVAFRWMRPIFCYAVGILGGLALGMAVYEITFGIKRASGNPGLLVSLLVWGFLCYLAAEMLARKNLKVLRQVWKQELVLLVVLAALYGAVKMDLFGYEKFIPDTDDVKAVLVQSADMDAVVSDEATVRRIMELHRAALDERAEVGNAFVAIRYFMKDGREVEREYYVDETHGGQAGRIMEELRRNREIQIYTLFGANFDRNAQYTGGMVETYGGEYMYMELNAAQTQSLFAAMLRDLDAGRMLLSSDKEGGTIGAPCYSIRLEGKDDWRYLNGVPANCTETVAALEALGLTYDQLYVTVAP